MTLKFDGWPRKIIGHLFYTTSSFVHNFKSIGEFKLELQSGNAQFGSKSAILCPMWPWNLMDDLEKQWGTSSILRLSFVHKFKLKLQSGKAQFRSKSAFFLAWPWNWWMTLTNNRAPLFCCFKLCVSFHSHQWILTGVAVWKRPIWVKIDDFFSRVTLKFDGWPGKTIGHLFYATTNFVLQFRIICEFKLELRSGNG